MFHLQHDPDFYSEILKGSEDIYNCDYNKIRDAIMAGPALENTKNLKYKHVNISMEVLQYFKSTEARQALENLVKAL